ncbi:MAG: hypothetical protein WDA27_05705 [Actinomycetota bacterium]
MTDAFTPRDLVPRDDERHENPTESGWSEWLSFAFADAGGAYGGIIEAEFHPVDGRAQGSVVVFLPGGNVAASASRARLTGVGGTVVGRLQMYQDEPMKRWQIKCKDLALVLPTGSAVGERGGAAVQLDLDLVFQTTAAVAGWAGRRSDVSDDGFVSVASAGRFEQPGAMTGKLRAGGWETTVEASGFRERGWGVRNEPSEWLAVSFGSDLAIATSSARVSGQDVGGARIWRDGKPSMSQDSDVLAITTEDLAVFPPAPGDPPVVRALTRATTGARTATGIALRPTPH